MNRTVIVTGGAAGIGREIVLRFANDRDRVAVLDVDEDGLDSLAKHAYKEGLEIFTWAQDLGEEDAAELFVSEAQRRYGAIDVLINNAGVGIAADVLETSPQEWDRTLDVNLGAVFRMARAVLPGMLDEGSGVIVNVASVAGMVGLTDRAAYCASKAGVIGLTRAMAADYGRRGLRINAICPGTVATEWVERMISATSSPDETRSRMERRQLDGKLGTAAEVAEGIFFLCSDGARFVNGSAFVMDGGMTAV